ncbi:MAG: biotin--[acetyl-CoA-carboxylase] ligase [Nitrospira sp.]|nr:biotin--[acetyl-CoA-carboxylase] ligase [Nitrospira sp.]
MQPPTDFPPLTNEAVQALLKTKTFGRKLHIFSTTTSTNTEAMALAQQDAQDGTVVVAEEQTSGKGRLGRHWHSPPGDNLYCSVILRRTPSPEELPHWLPIVPLMAAVAVARAVQTVAGLRPSLKWPNDILIGDRKLGGLLCESTLGDPAKTFVVIGIGVNVNIPPERFPEELRRIATSLAAETGRKFDRATLLAALLSELEIHAEALLTRPPETFLSGYARLCSTLGRRVRVHLADGDTVEGLADSIAPDGSLRIIREGPQSGGLLEVHAGDVIHLR